MLRRLYAWTIDLAHRPYAWWALGIVAFAESSFFPVPPDAMLIPMALSRPDRAWRLALLCTLASVVGGIAGYAIGYYLYQAVGQRIIAFYGYEQDFAAFQTAYAEWGLWIILLKGLTPIPYKLVTIASGVAGFDPLTFVLASLATRGARFFLVAAILNRFGDHIRHVLERYLTLAAMLLLLLVAAGILAGRYLI
jgi:membrane protein YqaA with SNARE-associated domain